MTTVKPRDGERLESLLRRFERKVEAAGILKEVRRREFYLKPSVRRKLKRIAAARQRKRAAARKRRPAHEKKKNGR
jgi:small subunit ribosomal protein S21